MVYDVRPYRPGMNTVPDGAVCSKNIYGPFHHGAKISPVPFISCALDTVISWSF